MSLDDIVQVSISTQTTAVSRAGFGVPLIAAYHTVFPERVRAYSTLAAMVSDGFATTDHAYLAAAKLLAQTPKITSFKIGRRALPFTQQINLTPVEPAVAAIRIYTVIVNGTSFAFTTDATPTVAEITLGVAALINAGAELVTAVDNNTDIDIDATTVAGGGVADPGSLHTIEVLDDSDGEYLWIRKDTTADPGIATDLANISLEDDDWYGLVLDSQSHAEILAAAVYIETVVKLFAATSGDTAIITTSTTDIAYVLDAAGYARTYCCYDEHPHDFGGAAWMGRLFPLDPGSATWKFKTTPGVTVRFYSATQKGYLKGKHCNYYSAVGGVNMWQEGWTSAGEFTDITRGIDWLRARLQERIFSQLVNNDKIPFTDGGVGLVESEVRAQLQEGIDNELLAEDPAPTVTVPLVADVSSANKIARTLPDVTFAGTLAGAIHSLVIAGVVSA